MENSSKVYIQILSDLKWCNTESFSKCWKCNFIMLSTRENHVKHLKNNLGVNKKKKIPFLIFQITQRLLVNSDMEKEVLLRNQLLRK